MPSTPRPRRRTTVGGVLGELLVTVGVLVLGFVGWQVWLSDDILGSQQQAAAETFAQSLSGEAPAGEPAAELRTDEPPVAEAPGDQEAFAVVSIPRFGDFQRVVGEGTSRFVLDSLDLGLAHYDTSAMPGDVGNFAIAGHRNGQGGPFTRLDELVVGDRIYVQTSGVWYVYEYRDSEYVEPTQVDVVAPVPNQPGVAPTDRIMTMTTCHPEWSAATRLITYSVLVGWSETMPAELAAIQGGA